METVASFDQEKSEVDAILASGIFNRAPNLALLFRYVCSKYFEGAASDIKEYNIAIEALGRAPDFDQKRDSIVRVEAYRLRKRLREYYEGEGQSHPVHIEIPSGRYAPRFVVNPVSEPPSPQDLNCQPATGDEPIFAAETTKISVLPPVESHSRPEPVPQTEVEISALQPMLSATVSNSRPSRRWQWALALVTVMGVATGAAYFEKQRAVPAILPPDPGAASGLAEDLRILAGVENGSYVDALERTWQSDRYFSGGNIGQTTRSRPVSGTRDPHVYQARREGTFRYDIPLAPGTYELKLYFAETVFGENNVAGGGETTRLFNVTANGQVLLSAFDVINDAGSAAADIKVFKDISPAADGKLHLGFSGASNPAFVNAIEILRSVPGKMRAVRIAASDRGIKDSQNRYWDPDRYAHGGQVVSRPDANVVSAEPEIYRSERFGNLSYTIPVAQPGRYGVTLYFAENWFGPESPGGGGTGSRIFDIFINGTAVRRNFDIFREAGGTGHAATVSLHGLEPNHQGKIVIALTPARNYACINALEVVDEAR